MELNLVFGDGKSIGAEGGNKMVGNAEQVCFIRAKEQDVVHVMIDGNGGVEGSEGVDKGGNINLTKGRAVCHTLRKNLPVVAGGGAGGIGRRERKGEARAVVRVKGDGEKAVLEIEDHFKGVSGECSGNGKTRLGGTHGYHGGIDLAKVMEQAPGAGLLFDDENGSVPRRSGGFNVTCLKLFLNECRGSNELFSGERPLRDPDG